MRKIFTNRIKNALRIILPIIFIIYACSISFFFHTHIINGVTIVHSHLYTADDSGNPEHEHSGTEIQLIQTLSTYFSTGIIVLAIILGLLRTQKTTINPYRKIVRYHNYIEGLSRFRPPPALYIK